MAADSKKKFPLGWGGWGIAVLAVLGMAIMAYLTYLKFVSGKSSFCDLGEGLSCSAVNQSVYSEFFGIPVAILGVLYFAVVLGITLTEAAGPATYTLILLMTVASLIFSLYLTYAEFFLLKTVCIFCETSKVLMLGIGGLAFWKVRSAKIKIKTGWLAGAVLVGLLGIAISYFTQRGFVATKNYDEFSQCLTEDGWAMYGTYWCPNCARQKLLFGDSFDYVEYVECDPRGDNPQTDRCLIRDIEKTPTWIKESEDNQTELERHIGTQPLERLAEISGCSLPE